MLSGLLSNIDPAFSEDTKKPLSEFETKQMLEQLENRDSLIGSKKSPWERYDAFFENLAETAKTHYIPPEIIYKLEEAATFHVDDQLHSKMRQQREKKQQERSEMIKKYKNQPDLFWEEYVTMMFDVFMREESFFLENFLKESRERPERKLFTSLSENPTGPDLDSYKLKHEQFFPQFIESILGDDAIEEGINTQMDPNRSSYKEHRRGQAVKALSQIALYQALPSDVIIRMSRMLLDSKNSNVFIGSQPFFIGIILHAKPTDTIPLEVIQQIYGSLKDKTFLREEIHLLSLEALLKLADRQSGNIPAEIVSILKNIKTSTPAQKKDHKLADRILNKMGCKAPFS